MQGHNKRLGRAGEDAAARFLQCAGYTVIARNVRFPEGEIDIVARLGELWVFAEVKTRRNARYGTPGEAVGQKKRERICAASVRYLQQEKAQDASVRYDVLEVQAAGQLTINHIIGAFEFALAAL